MKIRYLLFSAGAAVAALAVVLLVPDRTEPEASTVESVAVERPAKMSYRSRLGTKDDPRGRYEFDQLRLADPATGEIPANIRQRELAFAQTLPRHTAKTATVPWVRRGPHNVGGRTRGFGIDVRDPEVMLAGGVTGSIWKSTDGGLSWVDTFAPADLHSVTSLVQDTRSGHEDTWYAGTGERIGASGSGRDGFGSFFMGAGVYKSTDNGSSWAALASTTSGQTPNDYSSEWQLVAEVATDPSSASAEVYAVNTGGIARSLDGGSSWSTVKVANTSFDCIGDVAVSPTGVVYATLGASLCGTGDSGAYSSTTGDGGSFGDLAIPGASGTVRVEVAISPADEDYVWFLANRSDGSHTLHLYNPTLVTCDGIGGAPSSGWCDYSAFIPARGGSTGDFDSQGAYDLYLEPHPTMTNIVLIGGTSLYRLDILGIAGMDEDGDTWIGGYDHSGVSFARYNGGTDDHHPDLHSGSFLPPPYGGGDNDPDVFISGSDGGLHVTSDVMAAGDGSVDWVSLNSGYHTTQFYTTCMNSDDSDDWIGGGMQDNGTWGTTSASTTGPWLEELTGDGSHCQVANNTTSGTSRYASAQSGIVYRLVYNPGGLFTGFTRVDPTGGSGYLFINPFVLDPADETRTFLAGGGTVWRNSNLEGIALSGNSTTSTNWTNLTPPGVSGSVSALSVSQTGSRLYFGTSTGDLFRIDGADSYTPSDPITDISTGLPAAFVSSIAVDPGNPDRIMVTYSSYNTPGVWFSTDGGSSWTDVEGNLFGSVNGGGDDGPSFRSAALMPAAAPTPYWVATSTGVYSATGLSGGSTTWTLEAPLEIGNTVAEMIRIRPLDGQIVVGTHGHGFFAGDAELPIELAEMAAFSDGRDVVVSWTTSSELNSAGFDVEYRNVADTEFEVAGHVPAAGTSTGERSYSHRIGGLLPGTYEIRLKQMDIAGSEIYTGAVQVTVALSERYMLTDPYPNPSSDRAEFAVVTREASDVRVSVYDVAGRRVKMLYDGSTAAATPQRFVLETDRLAAGTYFVRLEGDGFVGTKQFVVVR